MLRTTGKDGCVVVVSQLPGLEAWVLVGEGAGLGQDPAFSCTGVRLSEQQRASSRSRGLAAWESLPA